LTLKHKAAGFQMFFLGLRYPAGNDPDKL